MACPSCRQRANRRPTARCTRTLGGRVTPVVDAIRTWVTQQTPASRRPQPGGIPVRFLVDASRSPIHPAATGRTPARSATPETPPTLPRSPAICALCLDTGQQAPSYGRTGPPHPLPHLAPRRPRLHRDPDEVRRMRPAPAQTYVGSASDERDRTGAPSPGDDRE